MRALVALAAGTVLLSLVALACTGGNDAARALLEASCTNAATMEAFTPVPASKPAEVTPSLEAVHRPDTERECRIRRALLRADDLPGWVQRSGVRWTGSAGLSCDFGIAGYSDSLEIGYVRDDGDDERRASITQLVIAVEHRRGEDLMAGLRHSCDRLVSGEDVHGPPGTSWEMLRAPALGDDVLAAKLRIGDDPDETWSMRSITIRLGDVFSVVFVTGHEGNADLEGVARRAAEKLELVGPLPPATLFGEACLPPPETPVPPPHASTMETALVQLEDLPAGWSPHSLARCATLRIDDIECPDRASRQLTALFDHVGVSFERAQFGTVWQQVFLLPEGEGREVFQQRRLPGPLECVATTSDGPSSIHYAPLDYPVFGDETHVYSGTLELEDAMDIALIAVEWRRGDTISIVALNVAPFARGGGPDDWPDSPVGQELARVIETADAKFAAAADEINRLSR